MLLHRLEGDVYLHFGLGNRGVCDDILGLCGIHRDDVHGRKRNVSGK